MPPLPPSHFPWKNVYLPSRQTTLSANNGASNTVYFETPWAVLVYRRFSMKQISEEEDKPFTSSLNIYPEASCRNDLGGYSRRLQTLTSVKRLNANRRFGR
jgi:hypothetical protein